jgi:hypothetical protein
MARYDQAVKDQAKALYLDQRSVPIEQLSEPLSDLTGQWVPADTLRDWRTRYQWDIERQQQVAGAGPILTRGVGAIRMASAVSSIAYLTAVVEGREEYDKDRARIALHLTDKVDALIKYTSDQDGIEVKVKAFNVDDHDRRTNDELRQLEATPGYE